MALRPRPRLFTVEEYEQMGIAGILPETDRVELINGTVIEMTPIGSRHAASVKRLIAVFAARLAGRAIVQAQDPIRASDLSMPEPDIALLRPKEDYYAAGHPRPEDVFLLVEVADSSLDFDRSVKAALYATVGITEYWVVHVEAGLVESHRVPTMLGYQDVQRHSRGSSLAPLAFPGVSLPVEDIVGPD